MRPHEDRLRQAALERGYEIAGGSLTIHSTNDSQEWRFVALGLANQAELPLSLLAAELATFDGVEGFELSHARN